MLVKELSTVQARSFQEHNNIAVVDHSAEQADERAERERSARSIAQKGDYQAVINELEANGLLEDQINRVKEQIVIGFLTPENWQMLTALELYDKDTFEHCVSTYHIARDKVEKVLEDHVLIAKLIEREGVSLEQFYRACLFHDIGKIEIPNFILNNTFTDIDWIEVLCRLVCDEHDKALSSTILAKTGISPGALSDKEFLRAVLKEKHIRAAKFVPIKESLTKEEIRELEARGFSPEMSLGKILEVHEEASERILCDAHYDVEGKLVGQHHNYKRKKMKEVEIPIATSSLCISVSLADVMHLADVQQALEQRRSYKTKQSKTRVLAILAEQAQLGYISEYITYLWISDELKEMTPEELQSESAQNDLKAVYSLLERYQKNTK